MLLALFYYPGIICILPKNVSMQSKKNVIICIAVVLAIVIGVLLFLRQKENTTVKKDDREKFSSTTEHFNILEEMALDAMRLKAQQRRKIFC
jgi:ABC-type uncharacterized transport system permease subunit